MVRKELLKQEKLFSIKKYFYYPKIKNKQTINLFNAPSGACTRKNKSKDVMPDVMPATKQNKTTINLCGTAVI